MERGSSFFDGQRLHLYFRKVHSFIFLSVAINLQLRQVNIGGDRQIGGDILHIIKGF